MKIGTVFKYGWIINDETDDSTPCIAVVYDGPDEVNNATDLYDDDEVSLGGITLKHNDPKCVKDIEVLFVTDIDLSDCGTREKRVAMLIELNKEFREKFPEEFV